LSVSLILLRLVRVLRPSRDRLGVAALINAMITLVFSLSVAFKMVKYRRGEVWDVAHGEEGRSLLDSRAHEHDDGISNNNNKCKWYCGTSPRSEV
jgi:hypothetical protein